METNVEDTLRRFLVEDLGFGDITTDSLVNPSLTGNGVVVCNEPAVIAGLQEAVILLKQVECEATVTVQDGTRVKPGTKVLEATGSAQNLLKIERVLLNLLSHMSGVATATRELVDIAEKASGWTVRVACTRKTLPGLRYFEKRAVELGGGDTHRLRLDDMVLIKDNHLVLTKGIEQAVKEARRKASFTKKIEIEVTRPEDAVKAAGAGADIVLLDNMSSEMIIKTVKLLNARKLRDRVILEGSGGISRDNIASYARTGVDVLSVGRITSSARSIDMSFDIRKERTGT